MIVKYYPKEIHMYVDLIANLPPHVIITNGCPSWDVSDSQVCRVRPLLNKTKWKMPRVVPLGETIYLLTRQPPNTPSCSCVLVYEPKSTQRVLYMPLYSIPLSYSYNGTEYLDSPSSSPLKGHRVPSWMRDSLRWTFLHAQMSSTQRNGSCYKASKSTSMWLNVTSWHGINLMHESLIVNIQK